MPPIEFVKELERGGQRGARCRGSLLKQEQSRGSDGCGGCIGTRRRRGCDGLLLQRHGGPRRPSGSGSSVDLESDVRRVQVREWVVRVESELNSELLRRRNQIGASAPTSHTRSPVVARTRSNKPAWSTRECIMAHKAKCMYCTLRWRRKKKGEGTGRFNFVAAGHPSTWAWPHARVGYSPHYFSFVTLLFVN